MSLLNEFDQQLVVSSKELTKKFETILREIQNLFYNNYQR